MPTKTPPHNNTRYRLLTLLIALAVLGLLGWLAVLAREHLRQQGFASGFDFLGEPAGFGIGEGLLSFEPGDPYWRAFAAGIANTLRVALLGIVLSALLGSALGVGRLSRNLLLRGLCTAYVELFRNIPLLLQLLAWYFVLTDLLPAAADAWQIGDSIYLSKSGLAFPSPVWQGGTMRLEFPAHNAFSIAGGGTLTPEFLAVLLGLVLYSAAYLAEIVRAGLAAIPRGQSEAAAALGLSRRQILRRIVWPQALRIIVPPAGNQFLSLIKNSSLAVAVGYPELVSVANTTLNQTGRAIECIGLIVAVYLTLSLVVAGLMNWLNRRATRREY
jgi:general L-amino acid transport system permease protein